MKEHFIQVMKHDYWANERLLHTLKQLPWIPIKAKEIFDHLIAAEVTWHARIVDATSDMPIWKSNLEMNALGTHLNECHERWMSLLETEQDILEKTIVYKNSSGREFHNSVAEILTHVSMHSQYHRGQVTLLIRDQLDSLPATDYIVYLRESGFMG